MSKVVASIYAVGVVASSIFAAATVVSLAAGHAVYSLLDWVSVLAFSAVPLGAMLFVAARREWGQKEVSGLALAFVIAATVLFVFIGFVAHAERLAAAMSSLHIAVCVGGYVAIRRRNVSGLTGA